MRNLVNNALKYTEDADVLLKAKKQGNQVRITVRDHGIGMTKQQVSELFTVSGKRSSDGTKGEKGIGLGLTLCREFVALHKGEIQVESSPGMGTTFYVDLPMAS